MIRLFVLAYALTLAGGCSSTQVVGSWTNPAYEYTSYRKILVVGISGNPEARQVFENTMAAGLKERGYDAVLSQFVLPPDAKDMPKEELRALLQENGFEAVLTMALARVQSDTEFRPSAYDTTHYRSFHAYYGYAAGPRGDFYFPDAKPSEPKIKRTFILEANFYDLKGKSGVMWNAQSKTVNPHDLNEFAHEYAKVLLTELYASGIID